MASPVNRHCANCIGTFSNRINHEEDDDGDYGIPELSIGPFL